MEAAARTKHDEAYYERLAQNNFTAACKTCGRDTPRYHSSGACKPCMASKRVANSIELAAKKRRVAGPSGQPPPQPPKQQAFVPKIPLYVAELFACTGALDVFKSDLSLPANAELAMRLAFTVATSQVSQTVTSQTQSLVSVAALLGNIDACPHGIKIYHGRVKSLAKAIYDAAVAQASLPPPPQPAAPTAVPSPSNVVFSFDKPFATWRKPNRVAYHDRITGLAFDYLRYLAQNPDVFNAAISKHKGSRIPLMQLHDVVMAAAVTLMQPFAIEQAIYAASARIKARNNDITLKYKWESRGYGDHVLYPTELEQDIEAAGKPSQDLVDRLTEHVKLIHDAVELELDAFDRSAAATAAASNADREAVRICCIIRHLPDGGTAATDEQVKTQQQLDIAKQYQTTHKLHHWKPVDYGPRSTRAFIYYVMADYVDHLHNMLRRIWVRGKSINSFSTHIKTVTPDVSAAWSRTMFKFAKAEPIAAPPM